MSDTYRVFIKYYFLISFLKNDQHEGNGDHQVWSFLPFTSLSEALPCVTNMQFSQVSQKGQIRTVSQGLILVFNHGRYMHPLLGEMLQGGSKQPLTISDQSIRSRDHAVPRPQVTENSRELEKAKLFLQSSTHLSAPSPRH